MAVDGIFRAAGKRLFDVVAVLVGLCLLVPIFIVIALVIRFSDGAPVLYREIRLGRHQRPFSILKFRTLRAGSPAEPRIAPEDDPRITACGRWLRRWRLDEFPTLINVLRGDMSLVGPRPLPLSIAERLPAQARERVLSVKPGITDPAAIHFVGEDAVLAGCDNAETVFYQCLLPARVQMSVAAIDTAGFISDLKVLARTLALLWSQRARRASAQAVRELLAEHNGLKGNTRNDNID